MDQQALLNQQFGYYLHAAVSLLDKTADKALQAQAHISLSQFLVLLSMDGESGLSLSQQAIADDLRINKAAVSRHIDALVAQGWVERTPHVTSRREYQLRMTEAGVTV